MTKFPQMSVCKIQRTKISYTFIEISDVCDDLNFSNIFSKSVWFHCNCVKIYSKSMGSGPFPENSWIPWNPCNSCLRNHCHPYQDPDNLNNYFNFHVCLSFHGPSSLFCLPWLWKLDPIPAVVTQNITNISCLVWV